MNETVSTLASQCSEFINEAIEGLKPNKAAAKRARKLSLEIEKGLKLYRKQSM